MANSNVKGAYYLSSDEYRMFISTAEVLTEENEKASNEVYQREQERHDAEKITLQSEWDKFLKMEQEREIAQLNMKKKEKAKAAKIKKCPLEHAKDLRMEDESEIQEFNRQILSAMYFPIQKAQLREIEQRKAKLLKEKKDMDSMLYAEHQKNCKRLDEKDEKYRQNAIKAAQEIQNQIQQNLEVKKLKDNMKKLEAQQVRETLVKMTQEDFTELQTKRENAQRFFQESMQSNNETIQAREQKRMGDKLAEKKKLQRMQKELERDAKYEEEQTRMRKEKDFELTKMWGQQKKNIDNLAEKQILRAQNIQNATAIEWRRKEKELSEKRAKEEAMLREARSEQIRSNEHCCTHEIGRQKEEFDICLEKLLEGIKEEKQKETKQHEEMQLCLECLKEQITERELLAEAKHRLEMEDTNRMMEEREQRSMCITEYKERKLREIRAARLPDQYIFGLASKAGVSVEKCLECHEVTNKDMPTYFPHIVKAANKHLQAALNSTG
ncbi:cilia- and flagella-associated protein 45-like [Pleuronectes platessa]|uniref:cilia- and flagella-associated protein 45-like n=1 Tax=Pleuronectes platessa TaxID=8262 RepID=UPI00232A2B4F|nr:cilia- and flagella-associated protein 45-like [Pleuronectes platessa]